MLAAAAMVVVHVLFGPPPAERVAEAVREVYANERVQREIPGEKAVETSRSAETESRDRSQSRRISPGIPSGIGAFASVLLWILVIAVIAVVLALTVRAIADRRASQSDVKSAAVVAAPAAAASPPELAEADRLAAEGRFDDAVHLLLLRAVVLAGDAGRSVPKAWTSREVLAEGSFGAVRRDALGVLVDAVERSLFGGRPLARPDWEAARAASVRFDAAEGVTS